MYGIKAQDWYGLMKKERTGQGVRALGRLRDENRVFKETNKIGHKEEYGLEV